MILPHQGTVRQPKAFGIDFALLTRTVNANSSQRCTPVWKSLAWATKSTTQICSQRTSWVRLWCCILQTFWAVASFIAPKKLRTFLVLPEPFWHSMLILTSSHFSRRRSRNSASLTLTQTPLPGNESLIAVPWHNSERLLYIILPLRSMWQRVSLVQVTSTCAKWRLGWALRSFRRRKTSRWSELHHTASQWAQRLSFFQFSKCERIGKNWFFGPAQLVS